MTLHELGLKYNTDKATVHYYTYLYADRFNSPLEIYRMLEIGILRCASLKMWAEYFTNALVYGFDKNKFERISSEIITFQGKQESKKDWKQFIKEHGGHFDIIIDDGGHQIDAQQLSLKYLFQHVKKGGWYVIEDLHTSLREQYLGGLKDKSLHTLNMCQEFIKTGKIVSEFMTEEDKKYLEDNIEFMELPCSGSNGKRPNNIVFIKKRRF